MINRWEPRRRSARLAPNRSTTSGRRPSSKIADMFGEPPATVYGHFDKAKTVPRRPKKTMATNP
ncbi:hypothetical protein SAMN02787118_15025 [Streptomyces mirabilis]|jgi:hypothetical protein|uniref:Uncharacterized protein n=1 Tax=Streptomyces mirabilis TaxID=68239 RepID=A0A1I2XQW6_9ACTN|nr:hypothetical protein SAMN02787118_15025 [Streptomyces mirabilis]